MAGRNDVNIGLNATNRASATIDQVKGSLKGLDGAAGVATKGLAGLAGAFGVGMVAGFVGQIGGAVTEMARMAGASTRLGASFDELAAKAGGSGASILESLKRASGGTISEYNLMLAANKAMMLGVADSAEEMQALMAVAATRGQALGLTMEQAFDNLVTGVGRGSALILDNLGISLGDIQKANEGLAASLGTTVDKLDDAQKKTALMNVIMQEAAGVDMGNVAEMASSFEQANAAIADMKSALGELFGPAIKEVAGLIRDAAVSAKGIAEAITAPEPDLSFLQEYDAATKRLQDAQSTYLSAVADNPTMRTEMDRLLSAGATIDMVIGETQAYYGLLLEVVRAEGEWVAAKQALAGSQWNAGEDVRLATAAEQARLYAEALAGAETQAAATAQATNDAYTQIAAMTAQMATTLLPDLGPQVFGQVDAWGAQLAAQFDALVSHGYTAEQALAIVGVAADRMAGQLREGGAAAIEAANGIGEVGTRAEWAAFSIVQSDTAADALFRTLGNLAGGAFGAAGGIDVLASSAANSVGPMYAAAEAAYAMKAALIDASTASLKGAFLGATDVFGASGAQKNYQQATGMIEGIGNALLAAGVDGETMEFQLAGASNKIRDSINSTRSAVDSAKGAFSSAADGGAKKLAGGLSEMDKAAREAEQAFNSLQSKVAGVLSGALNLDVGVNPEDFLPRPDAINENARRLADIMVNGFKGQDWMGEFAAEVPDIYKLLTESGDPKGEAARLLQEFQAGLVPELIDKEAAKERVRQMMTGEANLAELAKEIATELSAEMGTSLASAQAAAEQALGVTIPGAEGGKGATAGIALDGEGEGNRFMAGIKISITAQTAQLAATGTSIGRAWGSAFLTGAQGNVPGGLIDMLFNLLVERQGQQSTQTGAIP